MSKITEEKLDKLKKSIHPEIKYDVFTQARIVSQALELGEPYYGNTEGFAIFLGVSQSLIHQFKTIHKAEFLPEVKFYLMKNNYRASLAFKLAKGGVEAQRKWLQKTIGASDTLSQTNNSSTSRITEEENK